MSTPIHVVSKAASHFTVCGLHISKTPMFIERIHPDKSDLCKVCSRAKQSGQVLYVNHASTIPAL